MVYTWSRVSDRAHDSTCSIWRQATEGAVRYFTCFSLLKRSIHSVLFQKNISWQCQAIIAPCLVVVRAGERRGSVLILEVAFGKRRGAQKMARRMPRRSRFQGTD